MNRRLIGIAVTAVIALSACSGGVPAGSSGASASAPSASQSAPSASQSAAPTSAPASQSAGMQHVAVRITNDGCVPTPATAPAGAVTFDLTNDGADLVVEFEVKQGDRILGEKENLAPGLAASLLVVLEAGDYVLHCPIATTDTPFKVSAVAAAPSGSASALAAMNKIATDSYATYVREQTAQFVTATDAFVAAVKAGDVAKAKALYGPARVFYERIEPVAESFGDLDPEIDARIADVADPAAWTGFHRIEKALWVDNTTKDMTPIADKLLADAKKLQGLVEGETYTVTQMANGASELLDEVANSKVTGEEEAYSHIDLVDFAANVEGARAVFNLVEPSIRQVDPLLAAQLDRRFMNVENGLATQRKGDSYVLYPDVPKDDIRNLAAAVDALAEPLSQVAAKICDC